MQNAKLHDHRWRERALNYAGILHARLNHLSIKWNKRGVNVKINVHLESNEKKHLQRSEIQRQLSIDNTGNQHAWTMHGRIIFITFGHQW